MRSIPTPAQTHTRTNSLHKSPSTIYTHKQSEPWWMDSFSCSNQSFTPSVKHKDPLFACTEPQPDLEPSEASIQNTACGLHPPRKWPRFPLCGFQDDSILSEVRLQSRGPVFSGNLRDANTAECNRQPNTKTTTRTNQWFCSSLVFFSCLCLLSLSLTASSAYLLSAISLQ